LVLLLAVKEMKQKFACGASVNNNEIVIQGDLKDDVFDFILANYPVCSFSLLILLYLIVRLFPKTKYFSNRRKTMAILSVS
jgi:hypothetical protein